MAAIVLAQVGSSLGMLAFESIVGAAAVTSVGATIAGAIGAGLGTLAGSAIDRALFGSGAESVEGPRLSDLSVQTSTDGTPLPLLFGTNRLAGNVIWTTGLEEIVTVTEAGGGSGGGGTVTTYSYRTDVAIALCEGEIDGIRKIFEGGKLIYDLGEAAGIATVIASSSRAAAIRVYPGSETQEPDPLIQAVEGAANAPAFLGTAYVVFEDLQVEGKWLPQYSFEAVKGGTTSGLTYDSKCDDLQQGDGHRIVCSCADTNGLWVWRIDPSWLSSTTPNVYLYLIPWGSQSSYLVKTIQTSLPSPAPGGSSILYLCIGQADQPAVAVPFYETASPYKEGLVLVTRTAQYTFKVPQADGLGATAFALAGKYCFFALGANYWSGYLVKSFHLYRANLNTGAIDEIMLPWDMHNAVYRMAADNNRLVLSIPKHLGSGASESRLLQFDVESLALEKDILNSTAPKSHMSFAFSMNEGHIDFMYSFGGYHWYRIKEVEDTPVYQGTITAPDDWFSVAPGYHWHLFDIFNKNAPAIWYSYYTTTARAGWFKSGLLTQGTATMQSVCEALADRSGIPAAQYDFSALAADTVRGYKIGRPMTMRAALEPLRLAHHFDLIKEDGKILAVKRGGAVSATLTEDDLGASEQIDTVRLHLTRNNPLELPSEIVITYADIDNDYQPATQFARRLTATHSQISAISLPLAMTSQEAARLADVLLNVAWYCGSANLRFASTYEQARLSPADVVTLPGYGATWQARLTQVDLGSPGLALFQAIPDLAALYTSYAVGADASGIGRSLGLTGPTRMLLLDCCMLRDEDNTAGWYVALAGYMPGWKGGVVYKSNDGGATWGEAAQATSSQFAAVGYATTVLAAADCRVWDKASTLNVRLLGGKTVSSTTEAAVLNGANAALLGAHGRWELIQFRTATLEADGSYTLRDLLRGRKGTEYAAVNHAVYDSFVALSLSTIQDLELSTSELNAARQFKSVSVGKSLEEESAETWTNAGVRLKPLAPVLLNCAVDANGNLVCKWSRRNRISKPWSSSYALPNSETTESYEIDITKSSTVVRTLTASSETVTYSSANQATDGIVPSTSVTISVYQMSAVVGRGHVAQITVTAYPIINGVEPPAAGLVAQPIIQGNRGLWDGSKFVTASTYEDSGARVWTSNSSGTTWTRQSAECYVGIYALAYGGSRFVGSVLGAYAQPYWVTTATSASGPWTATNLYSTSPSWFTTGHLYDGLVYDASAGKFVIVGSSGPSGVVRNLTSTDGTTWSSENQTAARSFTQTDADLGRQSIVGAKYLWTGSVWVVVGSYVTSPETLSAISYYRIWTTANLSGWTQITTGASGSSLYDTAIKSSTLIAVGASVRSGVSNSALILRSTNNGASWTDVTPTIPLGQISALHSIGVIGSRWIAVGYFYTAYSDDDGLTWTWNLNTGVRRLNGAKGDGNTFLAASTYYENNIFVGLSRTTDGITWTTLT